MIPVLPTVRAASLQGFAPLVRELGGDPDEYFARFQIPVDAATAQDRPISITAHDLMLEAAATECDCPDLGLRLASRQGLDVVGPLAMAIESSTTPRSALEAASRYLFTHSPALHITVEDDPAGQPHLGSIVYRKDLVESPYSRQGIELGVGLMYRITVLLIGDRNGLRSVDFPHAPVSPIERYLDFFSMAVRFNQQAPAIRAERRLLDQQLANGNAALRQIAVDFLDQTFPDHPGSRVSTRVRYTVAETIGTGPRIDDVARLLRMHPRTLQRHLAREGISFQQIRDSVRKDAAFRMVTTTDHSFDHIAQAVGFTEQSTFSHAIRRWFGVSPRDLRRNSETRLSR